MTDAYLNAARRNAFRNELAHKKTERGRLERRFVRPHREPSDGGAGAAALYATIEATPLWLRLWKRERAKLPASGKRVLDALLVDWRSRPAARIAGVSQPSVDRWKKLFQKIFAQCFRAWKRDFGEK